MFIWDGCQVFGGMLKDHFDTGASQMAQQWRTHLPMQEMRVQSLGGEDALEEGMATRSGILAWRIPWTEEPGGLQSMESQRVGHDWATSLHYFKEEIGTSLSKKA